jgi:imidazoleglycerol-phosphate dehydratase
MRKAQVIRKTKETQITIRINVDGKGIYKIDTSIGFFQHMLETLTKHSLFDIHAQISGDVHVDQHHVVEDTGFALGKALSRALGDKKGIARAGNFVFPMDEALSQVSIDIAGRPYLVFKAKFRHRKINAFDPELIEDFLYGFTTGLGATLHAHVITGRSDHHKIESLFKALAKALQQACAKTRDQSSVPSTKGKI